MPPSPLFCVVSRKLAACEDVATALNEIGPGTAVAIAADLASDAACRKLAEEVGAREQSVDVLVNNAGVTWGGTFEDFPEAAWARTMTLNVSSIFHLTRAFVPLLKRASKGNLEPAHVINISSAAGNPSHASTADNAFSYAASKAATNKVTQSLAAVLLRDHIVVNCIAPAVFESKMTFDYQLKSDDLARFTEQAHPVGRYGNESDMGALALFLGSRASAFMTGSIIALDGGLLSVQSRM